MPWEAPCGGSWGCYTEQQRCDGYWHCPNGRDEANCSTCGADEFPCSRSGACYPRSDRCNYQNRCPNGSDEKNCFFCQPGNFHCKVGTDPAPYKLTLLALTQAIFVSPCRTTAVCLSRGCVTPRMTVVMEVMRKAALWWFLPESLLLQS